MLRRIDVEFQVKEGLLPRDDMQLRARHQIWQITHYDAHKISDAEFELLKDQLFERIRRAFYGEVEMELYKLEAEILRNTNLPCTIFHKIKELLKCETVS